MPSADLPTPRGPITRWLFTHLRGGAAGPRPAVTAADAGTDDDVQLALYCCYELHYRGFRGLDPELEWDLDVLALRADLEACFLADVERSVDIVAPVSPRGAESCLLALAGGSDGPSLSAEVQQAASLEQVRELCIHRSAYQLKEADPHTWVIPRLAGRGQGRDGRDPGRTSTATVTPSPCTPGSSPTPCGRWSWTRPTAPTWTSSPASPSPPPT